MRNKILKYLDTTWAGRTCLCFPVLDSTNDYGKEYVKSENAHGALIVAETQSAGKGRRGRVWQSPAGTTISMSLCLEPKLHPENASGLTLVMALAVTEAIFEITGTKAKIKWPNDIVLNGKKICGILTEMIFKENGYAVIIGTGINVTTEQFPKEIEEIAGSLKTETGQEVSRAQLIASVMKHFEVCYEQYEKTEDLSLLKERYENALANAGKEVRVLDPKEPYTGTAKGITKSGNLIVLTADGKEHQVASGEVSVRGLLGYV